MSLTANCQPRTPNSELQTSLPSLLFHVFADEEACGGGQDGRQNWSGPIAKGKIANEESEDAEQNGHPDPSLGSLRGRDVGRFLILVSGAFAAAWHAMFFKR